MLVHIVNNYLKILELYQCYLIQYMTVEWDMLYTLITIITPYIKTSKLQRENESNIE